MKPQVLLAEQSSFRLCNLRCQYCSPKGEKSLANVNLMQVREEEAKIRNTIDAEVDTLIYKISGNGEFTMIPRYSDFLGLSRINILMTNGTNISSKTIREISMKPRVVFELSIDGCTYESNYLRTPVKAQFEKAMESLEVASSTAPVQVNCVLTPDSITSLEKFCDHLIVLKDRYPLKLIPFPVRPFRGMEISGFKLGKNHLKVIERLSTEDYERYKEILPPKAYMSGLIEFIKDGKQGHTCHIPKLSLFIGSGGTVLWCGCGGSRTYGNIDTSLQLRFKKQLEGYEPCCANCYTPYEILNLYLSGQITDLEMMEIPTYSDEIVIEYLREVRRRVQENVP